MSLSKQIIDRILHDNEFSLELAKRLDLRQNAVLMAAKRNGKTLLQYNAVKFYKERGYSDKDINNAGTEA